MNIIISDSIEGVLLPINELICTLKEINYDFSGQWITTRLSGYGTDICKIEDEIALNGFAEIDGEWIFSILNIGNQYLFDGYIKNKNSGFTIGVFDSTFLFVLTEDRYILRHLKSNFNEVKLVDTIPII